MYGGYGQKKYATTGGQRSERGISVGFIERPDTLVKKAEALLASQVWEEVVVGLALLSGRCVVEVLKTGVIMPKTRYSLVFTAYQEQADQVLGPFELPTLVEAQTVLEAWQRVRTLVACEGLAAQEICAQYRTQIAQCAKKHFARRVPVASSQKDWYTPLHAQIYPLIATRYYCPQGKDPLQFAALVRGLTWPPASSMKNAACACCRECQRPCGVYYIGDGVNTIDTQLGLRLDQEGVEPLACVHVPEEPPPDDNLDACPQQQTGALMQSNERSSSSLQVPEQAPDALCLSQEGKGKRAERNLKEEVARQRSHFTEDDWEAYETAVVLEAGKQIQQEREASSAKQVDCGKMSIIFLDEPLTQRLDGVRQREGTRTVDGTLAVLLDGYEWLHRGGSLPSFLPEPLAAANSSPGEGIPRPYAIRHETEERLVAIDQAKAAQGLETVIEKVLDTYEWLLQGGLSKRLYEGMAPGPEGVWLKVKPQIKVCLEEIQEEEGDACLDETLALLIWTYGWLWRRGMLDQITSLTSTALSCLLLDEVDQETIEAAMKREKPEARFHSIQNLYLQHARRQLLGK